MLSIKAKESASLCSRATLFRAFGRRAAPAALAAPRLSNLTRLCVLDGLVCPSQSAEREEGTGSPDTREDAGASSGESNTEKVSTHGRPPDMTTK